MKYVYIAIIAVCTLINSAAHSLAIESICTSIKTGIPLSQLLAVDNNVNVALQSLSLKELTEVRT